MFLKQAGSTCWRKWTAKHEYEELNEGMCLEPALALLRRKTKEEWTDKHRNVARKLVLEGGWVPRRIFDIGCHKEEGTEKHRPWPRIVRSQTGDPTNLHNVGAKSENLKKRVEVAKRYGHASSQLKPMEQGSFLHEKVGVREAQTVENASRRLHGPRCR